MTQGGDLLLVTDADRKDWIFNVLETRFTHHGKLFLPDGTDYNELEHDEGLQKNFTEICRWIGVRAPKAKAVYGSTSQQYSFNADGIIIDSRYRHHPMAAGGLLALAAIGFTLQRLSKIEPDKKTIEQATIELGLSTLIINALTPKLNLLQEAYHAIDGRWFKAEGIKLGSYGNNQYVTEFINYTREYRIPPETFMPHIHTNISHLFPETIQQSTPRRLPRPSVTITQNKRTMLLWSKIALIALIIATTAVVVSISWPKDTFSENAQAQALNQVTEKHTLLDECFKKAIALQNQYDTSDIFSARAIESQKSRCASLQNEYTHALRSYQNQSK